jgi:hypothetical protein
MIDSFGFRRNSTRGRKMPAAADERRRETGWMMRASRMTFFVFDVSGDAGSGRASVRSIKTMAKTTVTTV